MVDPFEYQGKKRKSNGKLELIIWLWRAIITGSKIIKEKNIKIIFSRSMPVFGHLPALILAKRYHLFWISNWSDPAPLSISPPPFRTKKPLIDFGKLLCNLVTRNADWHTFPNEYLSEYMIQCYPNIKNKTSIIPHIAFSLLYNDKEFKSEVFRLCHIGSLWKRDPYPFFNSIKMFKDRHGAKQIEVLFIGLKENGLEEQVKNLELDQEIQFISTVSYDKSLEYLANCDVALVIEADTDKGYFFPSKVLDIIQEGKPILSVSPRRGVMADLLINNTGGISVDRNQKEEILNGIEELFQAYLKKELRSKYGSQQLRLQFSEDIIIPKFINIISKINEWS
jgi:glycosyltransferase involved in cell wall biosynthesis